MCMYMYIYIYMALACRGVCPLSVSRVLNRSILRVCLNVMCVCVCVRVFVAHRQMLSRGVYARLVAHLKCHESHESLFNIFQCFWNRHRTNL